MSTPLRRCIIHPFLIMAAATLVCVGLNVAPTIIGTAPAAHAEVLSWVDPVPGATVGDGFGVHRSDGTTHKGIDLLRDKDNPVFAPAAATITFAGAMQGYGYAVDMRFDNGWSFRAGHMPYWSIQTLQVGQRLQRGEQFAVVGREGDATCYHVHVELKDENGQYLDPVVLIQHGPGPDSTPDVPPNTSAPQSNNPLLDALNNALEPFGVKLP